MRSLYFIGLLLLPLIGSATIHRVNPDPASTAVFHDLQTAINAAAPLDSIYVEGNLEFDGVVTAFIPFGFVTLTQPVHIYGPGYFLAENSIYAHPYSLPTVNFMMVQPGAMGSVIEGLTIGTLQVMSANVTVRFNKIGQVNVLSGSGLNITQNYIQPIFPGATAMTFSGAGGNIFVKNNFIGTAGFSPFDQLIDTGTDGTLVVFDNNTIAGGISSAPFCEFTDNIFVNHQFEYFFGALFNFNIFTNDNFITEVDPFGSVNDPSPIVANPTNLTGVDQTGLFDGSVTGDAMWLPIDGSVATAYGTDGANVGMFTSVPDSYRLSGQSDLPVISDLFMPDEVLSGFPIPITLSAHANSGFPVEGSEYSLEIDNGVGNSIQKFFGTPGFSGQFFFSISSDFQEGIFRVIVRVFDHQGNISLTIEKDVTVTPSSFPVPDLVAVEYFVGSDPDFGNGTSAFNPLDTQDATFTQFISFIDLAPGIHEIGFRSVDVQGNYSITLTKTVLVVKDPQAPPGLDKVEYFFDVDPGFNLSSTFITISQEPQASIVFTAALNELPVGYHRLFSRSRDVNGDYGITQHKWIYVMEDGFFIADIDGNGAVNIADLLLLMAGYGCIPPSTCPGDMTEDGFINASDILLFLPYFGQSIPPPPID